VLNRGSAGACDWRLHHGHFVSGANRSAVDRLPEATHPAVSNFDFSSTQDARAERSGRKHARTRPSSACVDVSACSCRRPRDAPPADSGLLGIGSGALKVLAMDRRAPFPSSRRSPAIQLGLG